MLVFQRSDLLLAKLAHEEQQRYSINISRYYLLCRMQNGERESRGPAFSGPAFPCLANRNT